MPARHEAEEAEENLRVIRSLMEKATVYRAISAPGALLGGVLSIATASVGAGASFFGASFGEPDYTQEKYFLIPWLTLLCITAAANGFLLWRDAKKRGDAFISPGMKLVLSAMFPGMAAGGLFLFILPVCGIPILACSWVLCYGISLLAAAPFAPGSIRRLGQLFFGAGAALFVFGFLSSPSLQGIDYGLRRPGDLHLYPLVFAHLVMGSTFGLFHLAYAACAWPRRIRGETVR